MDFFVIDFDVFFYNFCDFVEVQVECVKVVNVFIIYGVLVFYDLCVFEDDNIIFFDFLEDYFV